VITALDFLSHASIGRDEDALTAAVGALALLVDQRDRYTGAHAAEVAGLARHLAFELGCERDEVAIIGMAARLHDMGKVAIPDAILLKPGPLTAQEWAVMHTHSVVGADVLSRVPVLRPIAPAVRGHHERWDGSGYPDGVAGEDIPLGARGVAGADAFNAMITTRPYSPAMDPAEALAEVRFCSGTQFDPRVVAALDALRPRDVSLAASAQLIVLRDRYEQTNLLDRPVRSGEDSSSDACF
jgi:HD-GYP domain-containing protein (c-di-GMP phosphodiesterase class II)